MVLGDVPALFDEHAGQHDFVAHDHFAIDLVVQRFALHLVPRNVFEFLFFTHFMSP
jgi:hypothetical protein